MISLETIANNLGRSKRTPAGWICQCPCHEDKEASLSLKITSNGNLAANCFAGCKWETIYEELKKRNLLPSKDFVQQKNKETIYKYVDESGVELFQKVRFQNKKGIHRHWNPEKKDWVWNIQGIRTVLYNLPAVLKADIVYLCEGEKDADNLNNRGLTATTNNAGALSWKDEFSESLKDKIIIICQDNDEAGKKRSEKLSSKLSGIAKEIRLFIPPEVPEHGDVTDWIQKGNNVSDIFRLSKSVESKKPKGKATREMFFDLFDSVLKEPKKCIFSEKLMTRDPNSNLWNPAVNQLDVLKSEAAVVNETSETKFSLSLIQPHFFAYEQTKKPEFLVELPEWDGRDRVSEMAYWVTLKKEAGVDEIAFSELVKEWWATVFKRLDDPMIQNKIMVLQGHQGAGKDTWISLLVDGLGQFAVPLSIVKEDKDTYLNLHRGLVMKISEFDKTAKAEVSTLKDIITTPSTNIRAPYDRDSKVRHSRASFISSANVENILRDYTGNRRFLIFEVETIEYFSKGWTKEQIQEWQLQCLAQGKYLADHNYTASEESLGSLKDYIQKKTPEDPAEDTIREYEAVMLNKPLLSSGSDWISEKEILEVCHELKTRTGLNIRAIREQLRRRVGQYRTQGEKRVWFYKVPQSH